MTDDTPANFGPDVPEPDVEVHPDDESWALHDDDDEGGDDDEAR